MYEAFTPILHYIYTVLLVFCFRLERFVERFVVVFFGHLIKADNNFTRRNVEIAVLFGCQTHVLFFIRFWFRFAFVVLREYTLAVLDVVVAVVRHMCVYTMCHKKL